MFIQKDLMILLAVLGVMLHCGIVSANEVIGVESDRGPEKYWVVGSYRDAATAQALARKLEASQALSIRQQDVFVSEVLHHRLLVSELSLSVAALEQLTSMGITPWLLTLPQPEPVSITAARGEISTPVITSDQYLVQVGAFSRVDEAMALERRLARAGLEVSGESKLSAGKVMHQVWVGPTHDLVDLSNRLLRLDVAPGEVRPVALRETSYANRSKAQALLPAPIIEKTQAQSTSSQYPKDFNLATLPKKRSQPLIVD